MWFKLPSGNGGTVRFMHDNDAIFIEFVLIYFVGSDDVDNDVAASSQAWASAPQAKRDVIMNRQQKPCNHLVQGHVKATLGGVSVATLKNVKTHLLPKTFSLPNLRSKIFSYLCDPFVRPSWPPHVWKYKEVFRIKQAPSLVESDKSLLNMFETRKRKNNSWQFHPLQHNITLRTLYFILFSTQNEANVGSNKTRFWSLCGSRGNDDDEAHTWAERRLKLQQRKVQSSSSRMAWNVSSSAVQISFEHHRKRQSCTPIVVCGIQSTCVSARTKILQQFFKFTCGCASKRERGRWYA